MRVCVTSTSRMIPRLQILASLDSVVLAKGTTYSRELAINGNQHARINQSALFALCSASGKPAKQSPSHLDNRTKVKDIARVRKDILLRDLLVNNIPGKTLFPMASTG